MMLNFSSFLMKEPIPKYSSKALKHNSVRANEESGP